MNLLKMKAFSLILVFSIFMIDGKNPFGQAIHQQNLEMSNIFPVNYQVEKNQQKQKGQKKFLWNPHTKLDYFYWVRQLLLTFHRFTNSLIWLLVSQWYSLKVTFVEFSVNETLVFYTTKDCWALVSIEKPNFRMIENPSNDNSKFVEKQRDCNNFFFI